MPITSINYLVTLQAFTFRPFLLYLHCNQNQTAMQEKVNSITVELRGDLISLKNKSGETFKAINAKPSEAVYKFNEIVGRLKAAAAKGAI